MPGRSSSSTKSASRSRGPHLDYLSSSAPIAEAAIARDAEYDIMSEGDADLEDTSSIISGPFDHALTGAYHRPSFVAAGPRPMVIQPLELPENLHLNKKEQVDVRNDERSLLRDNQIIPPKRPRRASSPARSIAARINRLAVPFIERSVSLDDEAGAGAVRRSEEQEPSDRTALLRDVQRPYGGQDSLENVQKKWGEAVEAGMIHTTWQREAKVLARYSRPLIVTFMLQYSLTLASVFAVGHIGKEELGAVSLASMTANITGYAVYQGLATSLDTLCAQAYGSGKKTLVGLQLQRMVCFLLLATIPIGIIWLSAGSILAAIVPHRRTAELAGVFLKISLIGAPGYLAFEAGKRFVQAQGIFSATLYVLLICAPLNALMHWLFVWRFEWGFIGAPIAVSITEILLPLLLFLYVRYIDGYECWGGFDRRALQNWGPMIRLSIPGLVMVLAEFLAFEILTLSASWISPTHLAAQTVLSTLGALTWQIPFPISIAASTRIANLIGATLTDCAKMTARVTLVTACFVGLLNLSIMGGLRWYIPRLYTSDPDVIALAASVLPLCAAFQLFDALTANCNGILRGLGRQDIGSYINLFAYYGVAMPISFGTAFGLHWDLYGLWAGPAVALGLVCSLEGWFIYTTDWQKSVEAAQLRNAMG